MEVDSRAENRPIAFKWTHAGKARRFQLQSESLTFQKLYDTIRQLEPGFNELICYIDDSGMKIVFWTDIEMKAMLALFHVVDVQIFTYEADGTNSGGNPPSFNEALQKNRNVHSGIICDVCDLGPIKGNRYKCMVCPDFDLCEACERTGHHIEHPMVRIVDPTMMKLYTEAILKPSLQSPPVNFNHGLFPPPPLLPFFNPNQPANSNFVRDHNHRHTQHHNKLLHGGFGSCGRQDRGFGDIGRCGFNRQGGFGSCQSGGPFREDALKEAMKRGQQAADDARKACERMFPTANDKQEKIHGKVQKKQAKCERRIGRLLERCDKLGARLANEMPSNAFAGETAKNQPQPHNAIRNNNNSAGGSSQLENLKKTAKGIQEALKNFGIECDASVEDDHGKVHYSLPANNNKKQSADQKKVEQPLKETMPSLEKIRGAYHGQQNNGVKQRVEAEFSQLSTKKNEESENAQKHQERQEKESSRNYDHSTSSLNQQNNTESTSSSTGGGQQTEKEQDPIVIGLLNTIGLLQQGSHAALGFLQHANLSQLFDMDPNVQRESERFEAGVKAGAENFVKLIDETSEKLTREITANAPVVGEAQATAEQVINNVIESVVRVFSGIDNAAQQQSQQQNGTTTNVDAETGKNISDGNATDVSNIENKADGAVAENHQQKGGEQMIERTFSLMNLADVGGQQEVVQMESEAGKSSAPSLNADAQSAVEKMFTQARKYEEAAASFGPVSDANNTNEIIVDYSPSAPAENEEGKQLSLSRSESSDSSAFSDVAAPRSISSVLSTSSSSEADAGEDWMVVSKHRYRELCEKLEQQQMQQQGQQNDQTSPPIESPRKKDLKRRQTEVPVEDPAKKSNVTQKPIEGRPDLHQQQQQKGHLFHSLDEIRPAAGQFPVPPMHQLYPSFYRQEELPVFDPIRPPPQQQQQQEEEASVDKKSSPVVGPVEVCVRDQPEEEECMAGMPMPGIQRPRVHSRVCSYVHPNVIVQDSVDVLVEYGYDNCNGWLTLLSETHKGDINDIIEHAAKDPLHCARLATLIRPKTSKE